MIEQDFKYYLDHQNELVEKYNGKYIVLVDNRVVGAYNDRTEAYYDSVAKYAPGTFMIQLCTPGENAYTVRHFNRVSPVPAASL